ncbi:MAG: phosphoenolpyruvate--protein phosphotransferase [Thermodesulfobacteriota bacterium]
MPTESHKLIVLEDVSRIVAASHDLRETLDHITALLAERMGVEVCSLYLEEADELVLRSTRGLDASAVGRVRMAPDEGLTGLAFQTGGPVNVEHADRHPRYKFFPGIGEEVFHAYLGVPLIHRRRPMGVLTVQTVAPRAFTPDEVRLLVTAASQISTVVAHARLLHAQARVPEPPESRGPAASPGSVLRGIGVAPGVARGAALPLTEEMGLEYAHEPPRGSVQDERERFEEAVARSIEEVEALRRDVSSALSLEDGAIFHAHLLMLEDRGLGDRVRHRIEAGESAAQAVTAVGRDYIETFRKLEDPYLRERAADVRDVAQRLLRRLRGGEGEPGRLELREPTVVIARDLTPSEFVRLIQPNLAGVAVVAGGRNSHTVILCRSAGIPAVVALPPDLPRVDPGQPVILDGTAGMVYLSPPEAVAREYARLAEDSARADEELRSHAGEPAVTRDGMPVRLLGNAALLSDVPRILEAGGEGVGLYRTEFPFLIRASFPDEDEQVEIYGKILAALGGRPATLRTLDVGGDKTLPYLPLPREDNPHLGWRSIRVSLEMEEPFRIQVRALLRASLLGPLRVVFPMISTVGELRRARGIVDEERDVLAERGIRVPPVPVGAMIEVPSAALAVEHLAPLADFFSLGTNDLAQYLLAVDRANRRVAHLYEPLHPTVLGVIARVVEGARRWARPVGVCGEMASRVLGAAALLALGVDELSVSPGSLPRVRRFLQTADAGRLRRLAPRLTAAPDAGDARALLREELAEQRVPELLFAGE